MVERVVYVIGAGFSAPLGIPVMSNFLPVARDLHFSGKPEFKDFAKVFTRIRALAQTKTYFRVDLENIEEVLSILDMDNRFGGKDEKDQIDLVAMIKSVIRATSPMLNREPNDSDDVFHIEKASYFSNTTNKSIVHGRFVLGLFKKIITQTSRQILGFGASQNQRHYSVVTLNNDRVLENYVAQVNDLVVTNGSIDPLEFATRYKRTGGPLLAKLHGDIDGEIVPPASQKIVTQS